MKKINNNKYYYITSDGKVYSDFGGKLKRLKTQINNDGYEKIKLNKKIYSVHRLVGEYYIENPNNYPQINHKDGNKINNDISNLEWCTNAHNQLHAWEYGLQPTRHAINRALTQKQADEIRYKYITTNTSQRKLAKEYNVAKTTIADILSGKYYNLENNAIPLVKNLNKPKLTMEQASEIREKYNKGNVSYNSLGREYGVDHKTIKRITDNISYVR